MSNAGDSSGTTMPTRQLGRTGLKVSRLCLGTMTFGLQTDEAGSFEILDKALAGVKPHLMVTDPPYGVEYDPDWRNRADRKNGKPVVDRAVGTVMNDNRADWREAEAQAATVAEQIEPRSAASASGR